MELDSARERASERGPRIAYSGARGSEEIIVAFFCSARYSTAYYSLLWCFAARELVFERRRRAMGRG
jgi:hypothetical protein